MTILSQKIKENRERFESEGRFDFDFMDRSGKLNRLSPDGVSQIKSLLSSSIIDILDTIEKLVKGKRKNIPEDFDNYRPEDKYTTQEMYDMYRDEGFNSALTLVQDFIKQTKKEIKI